MKRPKQEKGKIFEYQLNCYRLGPDFVGDFVREREELSELDDELEEDELRDRCRLALGDGLRRWSWWWGRGR